jgi:hypothetical protein
MYLRRNKQWVYYQYQAKLPKLSALAGIDYSGSRWLFSYLATSLFSIYAG